jgi:DNA (cytosine-5)-methyltransferase 1
MSAAFTGLTLFAGVGSSSRAIRDILGGHVAGAIEYMPEACESLRLNGFTAVESDIRAVDFRRFGPVDAVVGGPPCQPFSQSANNDGSFDERDMIPEFLRCVAETTPKLFLMEEVQTLLWTKHRAYFDHVVSCFEALGYRVVFKVVNTADHGVGQARKRLMTLGVRVDLDIDPIIPNPERRHVTMAEALGWDIDECFKRNQQAPEAAQVDFADDERYTWPLSRPSTTVVGSFRPDVQAAPGYRKAGDGPRQNTPGSVITTHEERLVLQGLPRDWQVAGKDAKRDLQVGNSCPSIVLADIIGANLAPLLPLDN